MKPETSRFMFGVLLFVLAVTIAVIGLLDLAVLLTSGTPGTLSQAVADAVGMGPGAVGPLMFTHGASFALGMLATHFTKFRMS